MSQITDAEIIYNEQTLVRCYDALKTEIDQYQIDGEIHVIEPKEIPCRIQTNLIAFIDENKFLPNDFLNRAISLNNLFRDGGVFCGPVHTVWDGTPSGFVRSIEKNYHKTFIQRIAKPHKVFYSASLLKARYLTSFDMETATISNYYYNLGYQDGILLANKNLKDKHKELWHRFVNSPELLDNEMPRWLYDDNVEENGEYLEKLVVLKCKYQIGFYEGMMGQKLI